MRDLEKDQNKENEPARRSLEFGNSGGGDSFSRIKPSESNVGIGKRARSSSPEFDGFESFENSISSPNPYLGTKRSKDTSSKESTPTNKRLKTSDVLSQFSQVRNKETLDVISSDPPLLELHIRFTTVTLKHLTDQGSEMPSSCIKNIILYFPKVTFNKYFRLNFFKITLNIEY